MTVFVVIGTDDQDGLSQRVGEAYAGNCLPIRDGVWLVRDTATSEDVARKLRMNDDPNASHGLVFAARGYFGYAPVNVWEWMAVKAKEVESD